MSTTKDHARRRGRKPSAYEKTATWKLLVGNRFKVAREIAQIPMEEASTKLGYTASAKLSQIETGARPPTTEVVIKAAVLYGTTADYLLGLSESPDRDPAVAMMRVVASRLTADVRTLVGRLTSSCTQTARSLLPGAWEGANLARVAMEMTTAVRRMQELNPEVWSDDLRGASTVELKAEMLSKAATGYAEQVSRAQRVLAARTPSQAMGGEDGQEQMSLDVDVLGAVLSADPHAIDDPFAEDMQEG